MRANVCRSGVRSTLTASAAIPCRKHNLPLPSRPRSAVAGKQILLMSSSLNLSIVSACKKTPPGTSPSRTSPLRCPAGIMVHKTLRLISPPGFERSYRFAGPAAKKTAFNDSGHRSRTFVGRNRINAGRPAQPGTPDKPDTDSSREGASPRRKRRAGQPSSWPWRVSSRRRSTSWQSSSSDAWPSRPGPGTRRGLVGVRG